MRQPSKLGFRKFIELEQLKSEVTEAAESGDFPDRVFAYLSAVFGKVNEKEGWQKTLVHLSEAQSKTVKIYIPIVKDSPKSGKEVEWNYAGRDWFFYSHLLAKAYGWTLEYISDLEVNDAFAHIQEILTDEQIEREFYHGLSEVSYRYDKSTKKSNYVPMKRPYWMRPVAPNVIKKVKIKKSLLPVGVIKNLHGLPEEYNLVETEKINPPRNP